MRLAYLAEPIDQRQPGVGWASIVEQLAHALQDHGFDVYRPRSAFAGGGPNTAAIQSANNAVLDQSTVGVVVLPARQPTLGVPVEIERFIRNRTPVLIVTNIEGSAQLADWVSRGAAVCSSVDAGRTLAALLQTARADADRPHWRSSLAQMSATLRRTGLTSRPLVFEPTGPDHVDTPTGPQHLLPDRKYPGDAGLDLYVSQDVEIPPHSFVDVPSGVKIDIPEGLWAMIVGRSSTLRRRGLLVTTGVIDAGWTGQLFAGVQNLTDQTVVVEAGDRVAQVILLPAPVVGLEPEWGRVPTKDRGERGFGSTGN